MMKVKILGAGSIGNHLANAARSLDWEVHLCDISNDALKRTKNLIYPGRYKKWDERIKLYNNNKAPKGIYDIIFIGTPPDTHLPLALEAIKEHPKAICVEKPICGLNLEKIDRLNSELKKKKIRGFVGYDHVVGKAAVYASKIFRENFTLNKIDYIEVEIKEHWKGIFDAHPWLDGPKDSYLGDFKKGGGACAEHSHGINMWQHFANLCNAGKINKVFSSMKFEKNNSVNYDKFCLLNVETSNGLCGRIIQDVVSTHHSKKLRVTGKGNFLEWICNQKKNLDAVVWFDGKKLRKKLFKKNRPEDFIQEMKHIKKNLKHFDASPISIEKGFETMLVIAAAHKSAKSRKLVELNFSKGYSKKTLITRKV